MIWGFDIRCNYTRGYDDKGGEEKAEEGEEEAGQFDQA